MIGPAEAAAFERCLAGGGVAVFPADTVYGLACDPESADAVQRLYEIKGRPPDKPAAVMFFDRDAALRELGDEVPARTREALTRLLPGGVTVVLPNPRRRFPLACGPDPDTLGLRVPRLDNGLTAVTRPVLQSSANPSGGADARRLQDVPEHIRDAADLALDGGELPGTPSTVVDLRDYARDGSWRVLREGAVPAAALAGRL